MAHVLILEDDPDIASLLRRGLTAAGHDTSVHDGIEGALAAVRAGPFDAAIIDMMLGDDSGCDFLVKVREAGHSWPALMLSALSRVEERASGLAAGAQDYVVKPFQFSELLARLEVQLRRHAAQPAPHALGKLVYEPELRRVSGAARPVLLTEREGELLAYLLRHPDQILSRGRIFDALWAPLGRSTENVVDVYIGYLRRKLGDLSDYGLTLKNLRGRGFILQSGTDDTVTGEIR